MLPSLHVSSSSVKMSWHRLEEHSSGAVASMKLMTKIATLHLQAVFSLLVLGLNRWILNVLVQSVDVRCSFNVLIRGGRLMFSSLLQ